MKQLNSSLGDLQRLFVRTITITLRDIAEPLASFGHHAVCQCILLFPWCNYTALRRAIHRSRGECEVPRQECV